LVHSPVITGTTQHVCTGATVFGNDYIQVSPTNVTLTLTNDATLTWQWTTNYWLAIGTNGYGAVSLASGWKGVGSNVSVIATPSANAHFVKWSGNTNGCLVTSNQLVAVMNQARTITAVFAAGSLPVIMGAVTRSDNSKAGLAGVTIAFSGGAGSTVTDGAGCYSNIVPYGWSGTVTATYTNGGFVKSNLTFKTVTKSKTKQNFVWSPDPVISGTVTTPDKKVATNVTLSASNGGGITITGSNGSYRLTVPYNWTGILAPAGGTSKPVGKSFRHLKRNVANVKFVFTPTQAPSAAPNVEQGLRIVDIRLPVDPLTPICAVYGFPQWLIDHGLTGDPSVLFDQDADGDGISNGAEYTFGANLLEWESLVRLLTNNARLTAEVPVQDPATLLDARETVEFTTDPYSGFWFPAVCLPPNGQIPFNKQWYQDFNGQAVKFRVRVERVP
jgi:hypothetical protein